MPPVMLGPTSQVTFTADQTGHGELSGQTGPFMRAPRLTVTIQQLQADTLTSLVRLMRPEALLSTARLIWFSRLHC